MIKIKNIYKILASNLFHWYILCACQNNNIDILQINYDIHYALRLCHEHNQKRACVQLFALLGMWKAAVDLALTIELSLAKKMAIMSPEEDVELKKKLWLKIGIKNNLFCQYYLLTGLLFQLNLL